MKTLGLSQINYCSFIFNLEFCSKKNNRAFELLYNDLLRSTFNLKLWHNRKYMYHELGLPPPDVIINSNLVGTIKRLKLNYSGTLLGNGH